MVKVVWRRPIGLKEPTDNDKSAELGGSIDPVALGGKA
jgi:hypothetical protein